MPTSVMKWESHSGAHALRHLKNGIGQRWEKMELFLMTGIKALILCGRRRLVEKHGRLVQGH